MRRDETQEFELAAPVDGAGLTGLAWLALAALALALIGLLLGCRPQGPGAGEIFLDEVRAFNEGVRWDRRDEVLDRLPVARRKDYLDRQEEFADDLAIDDWELDRADFNSATATGEVRLHYMWHRAREMILNTTYVEQHWKKEHGHWLMSSVTTHKGKPLPTFGRPERNAALDDAR